MSEQITNLKVRFGADTTQFKKGMNDGKKAVQDFKQGAGNAIEQFANQFGLSLGPLKNILNSTTTATKGVADGMKASAGSTSLFSQALKFLKVALISTGIGAIVVALGSLVTYFTKTQRGADFVSKAMKGIGAVVNVLVDRVSALGEIIFKAFSDPKKAIADLWEALKTNIVNRFEGILILFQKVGSGMKALWERDWDALKQAAADGVSAVVQITSGLDAEQQAKFANSIKGVATEIKDEAKAAAELEAARQRLRDQEISLIEIQAKRNKQIAEARLLAEDETVSAEKRLAAMRNAQALEQKTLNENKDLQKERIRIMEIDVALAESTAEDYRQLAEEKAKLFEIESSSLRLQKRLQTEITSLTKEIETETAAIIKLREEQNKDFKPLKGQEIVLGVKLDAPELEIEKLTGNLKTGLEDAKNVVLDFADTFNNAFAGLAVGFGESIGALISGAEGFDDLGTVILTSLADLAIQVGKIAIGAGIAVLGIKEALMSLNPAVAIAAGIALVAIGSAVKGSLKNAAGGGGSSGGTFTGNAGVYDTRTAATGTPSFAAPTAQPQRVVVTGTFTQRGSDMVAVINETNKRSNYR